MKIVLVTYIIKDEKKKIVVRISDPQFLLTTKTFN